MAGFQVYINGRFWVSTEDYDAYVREVAWKHPGDEITGPVIFRVG
jgi:uncharacterized short protein YbdD (DUF466 family)